MKVILTINVKKIIVLTLLFCSVSFFGYSQQEKKRYTTEELQPNFTYQLDTVINGVKYYKIYGKSKEVLKEYKAQEEATINQNALETQNPSLKISQDTTTARLSELKLLEDNAIAAKIDKKWQKELYSSVLFDSIYKTVSNLKYDPVDYPELSTDTLKARLKRLNAKTPFNVEYNPALESVIKQYLKRRRRSLGKLMGMSHLYFPLFEQELDNANIPLEIKYLAIVESALRPKAKSRVGATGLWQFMFTTGKMYGLDVTSYVDERQDPVKSTKAAAQYLSKLHDIFNDWDLALAAYNSGPGNVSKAIRRSGGYTNYWNIRPHLPRETAGYLPSFLATMYIFEYAKEHGFQPIKPEFQYAQTDTVHVKQMIDLKHVEATVGVDYETLEFLNPSYKIGIIPKIEGKTYTLRLPRENIGAFVTNENQVYAFANSEFNKREKPLPDLVKAETSIRYRVRSGDYLGKIASKYGVRVSQIKRWNGLRSNNLKIGQRLTIFPRNYKAATANKSKKKIINSKNKNVYVVKKGDTLWTIAQKYPGVSVKNIKEWNALSSNALKIGTKLVVSP